HARPLQRHIDSSMMFHNCPPFRDVGAESTRTPFPSYRGDSYLTARSEQGPLRHLMHITTSTALCSRPCLSSGPKKGLINELLAARRAGSPRLLVQLSGRNSRNSSMTIAPIFSSTSPYEFFFPFHIALATVARRRKPLGIWLVRMKIGRINRPPP